MVPEITDYADDLLDALKTLERWPEKVRVMQENWIGRSEGARVFFPLEAAAATRLEVFTTRPDTLFGASFCAHRAEPSAGRGARGRTIRRSPTFIAECNRMGTSEAELETAEKRGFDTGLKVAPSVRPGLGAAGLRRQFRADGLRHRRDLRLPGA